MDSKKSKQIEGTKPDMKFFEFITGLAQAGLQGDMPGMRAYDRARYQARK